MHRYVIYSPSERGFWSNSDGWGEYSTATVYSEPEIYEHVLPAGGRWRRVPMRNARFWSYINGGPVKITLKPGQRLEWSEGHYTDEGWSSEGHVWEYEDHFVTEHIAHYEQDCDGRMDRVSSWLCNVELLKAGYKPYCDTWLTAEEREHYVEVVYPQWMKLDASQRDYAAEAAGY